MIRTLVLALILTSSAIAEIPGPEAKLPTVPLSIEGEQALLRLPIPDAYEWEPGRRAPVEKVAGLLHSVTCDQRQARGEDCPETPLHTAAALLEREGLSLWRQLVAVWRARQVPTAMQLRDLHRELMAEQKAKKESP